MNISKDTVVQFHYTLKDGQGEVLESTAGDEPMAYLHGHGNILDALEKSMEGKTTGDTFSLTLEPKDAYGERVSEEWQRIPLKHLQGAKKWKPGMVAVVQTKDGYSQVTVMKVGKFNADVDVNHPLAGKNLNFEIEVLEVRDATDEEKAHGHAHGVGGHHH
jgi:FKBP-type peptidyl-prolyl cis-trans isomerase SlyD